MCIGCGACAVISNGKIPVQINTRGFFQAKLESVDRLEIEKANKVCPISDMSTSVDDIASTYFSDLPFDENVSRIGETFAGRMKSDAITVRSSAGGLTTHLLIRLLELGLIDGVIHVKASHSSGAGMFEYGVSHTIAEVDTSRKSVYYASNLAEILLTVANDNLNYALVGVPCFIKAGRLLVEHDPRFKGKIKFFFGLVCGHMKSSFFAESLSWQAGVNPSHLESIDFREKVSDAPTNKYAYSVKSVKEEGTHSKLMSETIDGDWGLGAFQPEACNFCDDIFADSADVVFGDAWLPEYVMDGRGTNIIIARNQELTKILKNSEGRGEIELNGITLSSVIQSQGGNLRHRREGLRVRLEDDRRSNLKIPIRRVRPGYDSVSAYRISVIRSRRRISRVSFKYFSRAKKMRVLQYYLLMMQSEKFLRSIYLSKMSPIRFAAKMREVLKG